MFPNIRLIIAALVASVVALSCGFGLFATFRVSHAPLASVAASSAPFQLVAASPALAGWAAAAGPVGTRPQVIQTALTEASVSAPFGRDNAEAGEPAALPVTTDATLVAGAMPSAESQPTSPPSNADVLPGLPAEAVSSGEETPTQTAAAAPDADQPSPPMQQQATAATAAAQQSAQDMVPNSAPSPSSAATVSVPAALPAAAEPTSTAPVPDSSMQSAAELPPAAATVAAATVAAVESPAQAASAPQSSPPDHVVPPAPSGANPDQQEVHAGVPTASVSPAVDDTVVAKPIAKHGTERAKPPRKLAHRAAARHRLAARRVAAPRRAVVQNATPPATTTTYQAFAFPQSNVPWTTQPAFAAVQPSSITPPSAERGSRVRHARIRKTAARTAAAGGVGGPFVKPPQ